MAALYAALAPEEGISQCIPKGDLAGFPGLSHPFNQAKRKPPLKSLLISQASDQERPVFDAEGKAIAAQL